MLNKTFQFKNDSPADSPAKTVDIVMRSRNDVGVIERTIKGILSQKFQDFDILNFDNSSSDGTLDIIKKYPRIRTFNVPEGSYTPGYVLNRAIEMSNCKVIVFNNSDAVPLSDDWLSTLIAPILSGEATAVYARQVVRADADVWVEQDYARSFGETEFCKNFFSLASSAMDASIFKKMKFDEKIAFSEDVKFANKLRDCGYNVMYVPAARAEHSHNYTTEQARRRYAGEGEADALIYGTKQSCASYAKGLLGAFVRDLLYVCSRGKFSELFASLHRRAVQKTAYYKARRDAFKNLKK